LIGNGGNDLLDGGPGIDRLDGGAGTNTLLNGENNAGPQFFIDAGRKLNDYGTLNADTFSVVRVGVDDVRATVNGVSRTFDMDDFDTLEIAGGPGNDTMALGNGIDNVLMTGGTEDDRITGNDRGNEILGQAGNDTLDGAGGGDQVAGGEGDDTLTGGPGGGDLLSGEDGNDTIFARDGATDFAVHGGLGFDRARVDGADPVDGIEQFLA
jgi:Ca2+-binding RTX toxin-like protein